MFEKDDLKYIKRRIERNDMILFLGSGFSLNAKNKNGDYFPTGRRLSELLWDFMGYPGVYDGTLLPEMYQAFISYKSKKLVEKATFLEKHLLSGEVPILYNEIAKPFWFKVYTLNVDDILDKIYRNEKKETDLLIYPRDEYKERDQTLNKTQIIHLNGKLPCDPNELIFSNKQYTTASLTEQRLYYHFAYDYATKPVIFLGTDINEPLFEKYIESRKGREGYGENRPKSFLISPNLSPVKVDNLRNSYNIIYIKGTTEDFLDWIKQLNKELPSRETILKNTFPNYLDIRSYAKVSKSNQVSIKEFSEAFNRVPTEYKMRNDRSGFFIGTSPRWEDIFKERDIPRDITDEIIKKIEDELIPNSKGIDIVGIVGTAGSGKSTILKRLGLRLSQSGKTVFLTYSDYLPKNRHIVNVLENIDEKVILVFDNVKNVIGALPSLLKSLHVLKHPPILVVASRPNVIDGITSKLEPISNFLKYHIPHLSDTEIVDLIGKLDTENYLGKLKGLSDKDRFHQFKDVAKKQILVALREATSGQKYDEIIKSEFDEIKDREAKALCVCIALNTELGFTNSIQDIVGFSNTTPAETLHHLNQTLRGTISWIGPKSDRLMLRHRTLADYIIKNCVSVNLLKEAYIRVLSVLAPELKGGQTRSRKFNLYRALINHKTLYFRFKKDIDLAREVYDSVAPYFKDDYQYWLQYGSLEVEGHMGDINIAENYIDQAESLNPKNYFIQNAKSNLLYKKACLVSSFDEAFECKALADDLANRLLLENGHENAHIFHIYCRGVYNYIRRWIVNKEEKKEMLEELQSRVKTGIELHPFNKMLDTIFHAVNRAYLNLGLNRKDIEDPDIPNYNR